ncbi:MAG: hydroxyisourate hydrolase [Pseudomonadota bacterium]
MATVSSHTLNSVNGTHAGGIAATLIRIGKEGERAELFESVTDEGGRFTHEIPEDMIDSSATYELILQIGEYFDRTQPSQDGTRFLREVVVRFTMPDPGARYHIPFMLAPNSYSVWLSG